MTEADRALLMAEYAKLSQEYLQMCWEELAGSETARLSYEKDHLTRCMFFADILEDVE